MALRAELWENRPNQVNVMSTNMVPGQKGRRVAVAPDENGLYGATSAKDIDLLTKTEALRSLKCRACRNVSMQPDLERAKKQVHFQIDLRLWFTVVNSITN